MSLSKARSYSTLSLTNCTSGNKAISSLSGIAAAFVWATYYLFIYYAYELNKFLIFSIPALSGSALLMIVNFKSTKSLNYLMEKKLIFTGLLYFASQFFIILSSERNGSVITALGVLLGDAVLTPIFTIVLRINASKIKYHIFAISMFLVLPSAILLTLYGRSVKVSGILGLLFLIGVILLLPIFFILLNSSVTRMGSFQAISGTFLWPGILVLGVGIFFIHGIAPFQASISTLSLVFAGFTSMGLAYILYFRSVAKAGFAITGFLQSLIPIFTAILVFFFEKTQISTVDMILISITILGTILAMVSISQDKAD